MTPLWVPDSMSDKCFNCKCSFSLFKRRHHCRLCGRVFCKKCVSVKAVSFERSFYVGSICVWLCTQNIWYAASLRVVQCISSTSAVSLVKASFSCSSSCCIVPSCFFCSLSVLGWSKNASILYFARLWSELLEVFVQSRRTVDDVDRPVELFEDRLSWRRRKVKYPLEHPNHS